MRIIKQSKLNLIQKLQNHNYKINIKYMKQLLACIISVFSLTYFSYSQIHDKSSKLLNVYYLSAYGTISDADLSMNSKHLEQITYNL